MVACAEIGIAGASLVERDLILSRGLLEQLLLQPPAVREPAFAE